MSINADNKKLVETLVKSVFQDHDFSLLDEIMRDDYLHHGDGPPQWKAGFIKLHEQFIKAIPDFRYHPKKIIAEGDTVMMYSNVTGTHQGEWMGSSPTGNKINYDVVDIFRIDNGKIAEHWHVVDELALFTQIGKIKQQ